MGIAPYKTFTFDGTSSATYGVYLTGEGVFNAPGRAVEMITIPGRNGAFALDQGRYENIEITYKAGMYDVNESNFATKMSNFRNWICSKVGYCRLEDDYNPNEYRMAIFKAGIEVSHDFLIAGEFEITFECKPQRWSTAGETATAVASGGSITNPYVFDSSPLLTFDGYGDITFNGSTIKVAQNEPVGQIIVAENQGANEGGLSVAFDDTFANAGDDIILGLYAGMISPNVFTNGPAIESWSVTNGTWWTADFSVLVSSTLFNPSICTEPITFSYGTSQTLTDTATFTLTMADSSTKTVSMILYLIYDGMNHIQMVAHITVPTGWTKQEAYYIREIILDSSTPANFGIHVDLDIGEAYIESGGVITSINNIVSIPSQLPTLAPGSNTITYDNTITDFKVTPRWCKL